MRLIVTYNTQKDAERVLHTLQNEGLSAHLDTADDAQAGETSFQIWVIDEEDIEPAEKIVAAYGREPEAARFQKKARVTPTSQRSSRPNRTREIKFRNALRPTRRPAMGSITLGILLLCALLFTWTQVSRIVNKDPRLPPEVAHLRSDPLLRTLMFDYSKKEALQNELTMRYGAKWARNPATLPPSGIKLLSEYNRTREWQGLYHEVSRRYRVWREYEKVIPWTVRAPIMEKISQGEIWRLFTPALLHGNLFHIIFNMMWLLSLGNQMEARLGKLRYLLFILITGTLSNIAQYAMGGPHFLGYSGVVCAMIGFIWMRQRRAPWEGYFLQKETVAFVTLFVLALAALQVYAFYTELSAGKTLASGIANTAHIGGALAGIGLAYTPLFSWKQ